MEGLGFATAAGANFIGDGSLKDELLLDVECWTLRQGLNDVEQVAGTNFCSSQQGQDHAYLLGVCVDRQLDIE